MPRTRPATDYLPGEWKEYRNFINLMQKILVKAKHIQTDVNWAQLMALPISKVERTEAEALAMGQTIPTLSRDESTTVKSNDDVPLMVFIKEGLIMPWKNNEQYAHQICTEPNQAIENLVKAYQPPMPKTTDKRHIDHEKESQAYKDYGIYHFALWKATGHPNTAPTISADVIASGAKFSATMVFMKKIAPLVQTIGMLMAAVDPQAYEDYHQNYNYYLNNSPLEVLQTSKRACFLGLAILKNARVGPHKDNGDVKDGWVAMCCWGDFSEGGELVLPALNMKIQYLPGDVIFFRSTVFEHFVMPWVGERSVMVFFTKKFTWKQFHEESLVETINY